MMNVLLLKSRKLKSEINEDTRISSILLDKVELKGRIS